MHKIFIPRSTSQFKKDYKKLRHVKDTEKLQAVIDMPANSEVLPPKFRDHLLKGKYKGFRDCHIESDWVLIYKFEGDELILYRTGSHSDFLDKEMLLQP